MRRCRRFLFEARSKRSGGIPCDTARVPRRCGRRQDPQPGWAGPWRAVGRRCSSVTMRRGIARSSRLALRPAMTLRRSAKFWDGFSPLLKVGFLLSNKLVVRDDVVGLHRASTGVLGNRDPTDQPDTGGVAGDSPQANRPPRQTPARNHKLATILLGFVENSRRLAF